MYDPNRHIPMYDGDDYPRDPFIHDEGYEDDWDDEDDFDDDDNYGEYEYEDDYEDD